MAVIQVMGKEELAEFLGKHKKDVIEKSKKAVKIWGSEFQKAVKQTPPTPHYTGTLVRSIRLDIADQGLTAVVYPTVHYAEYLEYGTRFMNAQPFMRPTLQKIEPMFIRTMDKIMDGK